MAWIDNEPFENIGEQWPPTHQPCKRTAPVIATTAKTRPARLLLFAPPKWGKTSWAAFAPAPVFLMTRGEDGLLTLLSYGRVPETPYFENEAMHWGDVERAVRFLTREKHEHKTFVIDTINGAMQLLCEAICGEQFDGDMKEFDSYGRGYNVAIPKAAQFVESLEVLRQRRGMSIILLCHSRVKTQKNPGGNDFDQHQPELNDKLGGQFDKWADCILYGGFRSVEVKAGPGKVKVKGEATRTILTGESAAHRTGNRFGLPREIVGGTDGRAMWNAFAAAMKNARPKPPAESQQPPAEPAPGQDAEDETTDSQAAEDEADMTDPATS